LNKIIAGDATQVLKTLPSGGVDCCVTSPPYWGLRDYSVAGQLGHEATPELYICALLEVFREVRRVLKPSGTCFVNLGDTYSAGGTLMIPYRFACQMIDTQRWILRNVINWHKPNQMPSPARDRFTVDFEPVFFFAKSRHYHFTQQLEPYTKPLNRWGGDQLTAQGESTWATHTGQRAYRKRDMRTTWSICTQGFKGAHFAVYQERLVERIIRAGCPEEGTVLDPFVGSGTTAMVARRLGRNYMGIDLNPEYVHMAAERLKSE
jgi:site-specific DNA-methyltransferase (adenine-specific)